jgi:Ca2+-binding RTX toxin-like protein
LFAIILLLCFALIPSAAAQQNTAVCTLRTLGQESANIRQEPSQGAAVVARLEAGQTATAIGKVQTPEGAWYQVETGYVASWVVTTAGSALDGYVVIKLAGSPYAGAFDIEAPADPFFGTICPDVIHGTNDADTIFGGEGDDVLIGYDGDDTLVGDLGDDVLFGGNGGDALYGSGGLNLVYGMAGADRVFAFASVEDYVLLDGFIAHRLSSEQQVTEWFGADVLATQFAPAGTVGDIIVTTRFVFVGQP